MKEEKRNKIKEILQGKPEKWLRILLDVWSRPEKDLRQIGIENGYKPASAHVSMTKIMKDPAFQAALSVLMDDEIHKAEDRRSWWIRKMEKAIARCEAGISVNEKGDVIDSGLVDSDGDPIGPMRDAKNFFKGMELIARAEQLFVVRDKDGHPVVQYQQNF